MTGGARRRFFRALFGRGNDMTWKDVKLATLQKMVSADGNTIPNDDATKDYLAAMPQAANEALQLLSTANKFLRQYADVSVGDAVNGYTPYYDMQNTGDFYRMGEIEVYKLSDDGIQTVRGVTVRAGSYVSFPGAGDYRVFYDAWPDEITENTKDTYELPLDTEVAVLLPLYMASQLYKDDDISIATIYRNEFEVARAELKNRERGTVHDRFVSESGWW